MHRSPYQTPVEDIIFFSIAASIITFIILFVVIRYASRATSIYKNQIYMIQLLKLIAQKKGATDDEINELLQK